MSAWDRGTVNTICLALTKFQQLNLHHCKAAMAEVGSMPDSIYLLQDPYYTPAGRPGVRKPSNFHSVGTARAAIYVSSIQSCAFVPMPQFTCHDIATGILEGGCLKQPVVVASVYLEDCRNSREAKPAPYDGGVSKLLCEQKYASHNGT